MDIDHSSDSDCTLGLLAEEEDIPELEKTAENGWIQILMTPRGPYDYENDPAGLYGGREVDDRPSLIEFYHQHARTNGFFARMAPTQAERAAAAAAAAKLAQAYIEPDAEETSGEASILASSTSSVVVTPVAKRSYSEV